MSVRQGKGGTVAITATAQLVDFTPAVTGEPRLAAHSLEITNTGANTVYVQINDHLVADYVESTAIPILAGKTKLFEKELYWTFIIATATGETSTIVYTAY